MKIHEYQAKELFKKYSIPFPDGGVAFSTAGAVGIAKRSACEHVLPLQRGLG